MHLDSLVSRFILALVLLHMAGVPAGVWSADKPKKTIIGAVEEVILLPWGIRIPARIDTGAARTSLGAQEMTTAGTVVEFDVREGVIGRRFSGVMAHFRLRDTLGGKRMKLPILDWRTYKTSEGVDRRPIVEIELCIGRKRLRTRVNLNKRRHLKYPLLIGRGVLAEGEFLVDVTKSRLLKSDCRAKSEKQKGAVPPGSR